MTWDGRERRAHRRYGVKGSLLRWKPGAPMGWISPTSVPHLLIDLSADGCQFLSETLLRPGKRLALSIEAPKSSAKATARVAWSRRSEEHGAWLTGLVLRPGSSGSAGRLKTVLDGAVLDRIEITSHRYLKETGRL